MQEMKDEDHFEKDLLLEIEMFQTRYDLCVREKLEKSQLEIQRGR